MSGYEAGSAALEGIAGKLRSGADEVEGVALPRSAPDAGACTGAVAAALSFLAESAAGISEGLQVAATAVVDSNESYMSAEQRAADDLSPHGPN
ncbi:MAG: hypothetical protein GEU98_25355 [Pseudonocardiaceae bacterium]|nr:hypothetical protein [Pseudonocardiaceae bacterium]